MNDADADVIREAEVIAAGAEVVIRAEIDCAAATIIDGLSRAADAVAGIGRAAEQLIEAFAPLAAMAAEVQRHEDEHVALWDDELPF